ncbi:unnamed protein product [Prunus armeniaca]|uniref:Uncharacterized protein n=1 Tax=Prunus armeniaca TaxID=36596 RepID=A0A6J5U1X3_PRUAR|nr:unnamed protein product [Prunus armeniaca]
MRWGGGWWVVVSQQQKEINGEGKKVWVIVELGFWVCWEGSVEFSKGCPSLDEEGGSFVIWVGVLASSVIWANVNDDKDGSSAIWVGKKTGSLVSDMKKKKGLVGSWGIEEEGFEDWDSRVWRSWSFWLRESWMEVKWESRLDQVRLKEEKTL